MNRGKGLSVPVIVSIGILVALLSLAVVLAFQFIANRFSPTATNAERYLRRGKLEEAFAMSAKVPGETTAKSLLRGRVFLAFALKQRKDDGWRQYGTDALDWLKGPEVDSALACFKKAIGFDKQSAAGWYWMGVVYKEKGWFREAEDALHESLRLDPESIDARLALASLYPRIGRPREAAGHLLEAYQLMPDNPQVAKNLALLYRFHLENPESAMIWFNRYLNNAPPADIAVNQARIEMNDLIARYPEFVPKEKQRWQQNRRTFVPRTR
jgi:tetratricopeptide (TPR) repeat protein